MDQFCIETFGLITPKAMACSLPVITSCNEEIYKECYATPPLMVAKEEEIFEKLIYCSKHNSSDASSILLEHTKEADQQNVM